MCDWVEREIDLGHFHDFSEPGEYRVQILYNSCGHAAADETVWDGGFTGNPALFPFFDQTRSEDILLVQINPIHRDEVPTSGHDIMERVSEITFNESLLREFRAIDFVNRLVDSGKLSRDAYMRPFMHRIDGAEPLKAFDTASRLSAKWRFLQDLRDIGRTAANHWLAENYDAIGQRATLDLRMAYTSLPANGNARRPSA